VFASVAEGLAAWSTWIKRRSEEGLNTAFSLMSLYAPPDDCVGSIGTPPDCPHGLNPTREYAKRIAAAVGKGPDDALNLDGADCSEGRVVLSKLLTEVVTFEVGSDFCGGACLIDARVFTDSMDSVWGPCN
jgi:hypothetical protein